MWVISDSWLLFSLADQVGSVFCTKTWQEKRQLLCESHLSKTKHYFTNRKSQPNTADAVCSSIRRWQYAVKLTTLNTRDSAKVSTLFFPPEIFFVCLLKITDVLVLILSFYPPEPWLWLLSVSHCWYMLQRIPSIQHHSHLSSLSWALLSTCTKSLRNSTVPILST